MNIGFPKTECLTGAREMYLLGCRAAGLTCRSVRSRRDMLGAFIAFVGNITVQELTPDHVRLYIAHLAKSPGHCKKGGGKNGYRSLTKHYAVIRAWIRWLYAQKAVTERHTNFKPPRLTNLFTAGEGAYCS